MMKQPLALPQLAGLKYPSQSEWTEPTNSLFAYESKHPESAETAKAFAARLKSRPTQVVVFDKDGTLGDCTASLRRWVHHMTNRLQSVSHNEETLIQLFHQQIGWDANRNDVVPSAPVAAGTWESIVGMVRAFMIQHQDRLNVTPNAIVDLPQKWHDELGDLHGQDTPLLEDLPGMMRECQRMGYVVAVCTSDDRAATDMALNGWGIAEGKVVEASICGDEVTEGKPSAAPLQALCQKISVYKKQSILPQDCIVVGDTTSDTGMARNANAGFCVGVLTGSGTTKQLLETGAHLILPHVGHVPALLKTLERMADELDLATQ